MDAENDLRHLLPTLQRLLVGELKKHAITHELSEQGKPEPLSKFFFEDLALCLHQHHNSRGFQGVANRRCWETAGFV